jgi:xanthine dehydrogenase accessory factor
MKEMFQAIIERSEAGEKLVMVTVVASSGATPRGAGARMLAGADGRICGTIGGGAVEYRALSIAQKVLREGQSREHDFSLTKDDVQNLGMICGGAVNVYFSFLPAKDEGVLSLARKAVDSLKEGKSLWLLTNLALQGEMALYTKEDGFSDKTIPAWVAERLTRHPVRVQEQNVDYFTEQIGTPGSVYIFGGGHVAQELVPVLARVGFRCIVCEDRPEFAREELFSGAEKVLLIDMNQILTKISITEEDYACVMTRGHAFDTVIQAQLLKTPACYIGVIGSAHKKAGVYQKLYEMGFTSKDTERITSPIGLDILAETPAEIAVSIAGQMIRHRAERAGI